MASLFKRAPGIKAKTPALTLETDYKSGLEKRIAAQLTAEGVPFGYETRKIKFTIPAREASYRPDWNCPADIIIESKGYFRKPADRQRLVLIKEQHPDLDIRIVFQDASKPIYKRSPTSYAKWATDHGFPWADKGIVPAAWIREMKRKRKK